MWSPWTATWLGTDLETGSQALVRALRADSAQDAVLRRAMAREGRALAELVPGLRIAEGLLVAPLPGTALAADPRADTDRLARLIGTGLSALVDWERAGMLPVASLESWRETSDGLVLVVLEAAHRGDAGHLLASLATALAPPEDEHPVDALIHSLTQAPPRLPSDAARQLVRALATELASRRHTLFRGQRDRAHTDRATRLLAILDRLEQAVPPPQGRGAVGVDLEGQPTSIQWTDGSLTWGPKDDPVRVWSPEEGFDAVIARRLLRARAAAPPSERLQEEVGGSAAYTQAAGRWISSGLRLRTLRLLLHKAREKQAGAEPTT